MARYALNLPASLKDEAAELAKEQGVSLNQFILWAVSEKVGTLRQQLIGYPEFPQIVCRYGGDNLPTPILKGSGIRVQTIVVAAKEWGMSAEEIAAEYERPLAQIQEALAFYKAHPNDIDNRLTKEKHIADRAGYGTV